MRRPTFVVLLLIVVVLSSWWAPAAAHSELAASTPTDGEAVGDPPSEVELTFTSALQPGSDVEAEVIDPAGDDLVAAPPTVDGTVVTIPLNLAVNPGEHTVRFAFVAADGDRQTDSITFVLDPPQSVLTPLPATSPGQTQSATESPNPATPTGDDTEPTAAEETAADLSESEAAEVEETESEASPSEATPAVQTESPSPSSSLPSATASPTSVAGGISPVLGLVLGGLALAAVAAVLVLRVRRPDQDV